MGIVLGAVTQSVTAAAFIVSSMVGGGLLTVRRALPVVACANLGTAALVLVAGFDVHLAVLFAVGLMGVAVAFDLGGPAKNLFATLFFAALLFFGLRQMRDAFGPLTKSDWFSDVAAMLQQSLIAAFLAGAVLRLVIQSSPAIAIIAITLARGGLLTGDQVIATIFGTGLGVGGAVVILSSNIRGVPRQIALYQALLSGAACLAVGSLVWLEHLTGWPLLVHGLRRIPGGEPFQLACAFAAMQTIAVLLAAMTSRWAAPLLARLAPASVADDLGQPAFIHAQALRDPSSALGLAMNEQQRMLDRLPLILDTVRVETAGNASVSAHELQTGTRSVARHVREFLADLAPRVRDTETSASLLSLQKRETIIGDATDTACDFVKAAQKLRGEPALASLLDPLIEGLHALVCTMIEAVERPDEADRELLLAMTSDRGDMMERHRRAVLNGAPTLAHDSRLQLYYLTSLFEREVWLMRQLAVSLPVRPGAIN